MKAVRLLLCLLPFLFISGCASDHPLNTKAEPKIFFMVGYDGDLKPVEESVTVVLGGPVSIHEIEGRSTLLGSQFRNLNRAKAELSLFGTDAEVVRYLLLQPGKTKVRLYFNNGAFTAGDGFQKILFEINGKPGDVVKIGHSFGDIGRRAGIVFSQSDLNDLKDKVRSYFEIAKVANKDIK